MSDRNMLRVKDIMTSNVVVVSEEDGMLHAASKMADHNISSVVALNASGEVCGVLTENDIIKKIVRTRQNADELSVRDVMTSEVYSIPSKTPVSYVEGILRGTGFGVIPVIDEGEMVGVVSRTDVCGILGSLSYFRRVRDIMTRNVVTVYVTQPVSEVVRKMAGSDITSVVVLDGSRIAGMFTEKDLIYRVVSQGKDPTKTKITEVMTSPVFSIKPDENLIEANRLQKSMNLRVLPVVDNGTLVGVISETDILHASESMNRTHHLLTEITDLAMQNSVYSITQTINKEVNIQVNYLECENIETISEITESKTSKFVGVYVKVKGELAGNALLLFPEQAGYMLFDAIQSLDEGTIKQMDDRSRFALKYLSDIMFENLLSAATSKTGFKMEYSILSFVDEPVTSIIKNMRALYGKTADYSLITRISCKINSMGFEGLFLFFYTPESLEKIAAIMSR